MNIYIHIPFCHHKCHYCYYYSFVPRSGKLADDYLLYLEKEFYLRNKKTSLKKSDKLETVYIGGGTPNYLSDIQLEKLFLILEKYLDLKTVKEFIIELNPAACSLKQLEIFKKYGVSRLSFGIQTLNQEILKKLNRHHIENSEEIIRLAKKMGFMINLDFMLGLPGQTMKDAQEAINFVERVEPESSFWCELRCGTRQIRKFSNIPSREKTVAMYETVRNKLTEAGYRQTIPEYFTNQKRLPLYLEKWWTSQKSIGFGLSAFSKIGSNFSKNTDNLEEYAALLNKGELPVRYFYRLDREDLAKVFLVSELKKGFADLKKIKDEFGVDLGRMLKKELEDLKVSEMISVINDKIRFSERGFALSSPVANLLLKNSQHLLRLMDTAFNFIDNMPNLEGLIRKYFIIIEERKDEVEELVFLSPDKKGVGILKRYVKK